jgi:hypothetical protein
MEITEIISAITLAAVSALTIYIRSYIIKRGEIEAIRKDLSDVTRLTKKIEAEVAGSLWINQNLWNQKRDTYFNIFTTLVEMRDALNSLVTLLNNRPEKLKDLNQPELLVLKNNMSKMSHFVAPAHIVLCENAGKTLEVLRDRMQEIHAGSTRESLLELEATKTYMENFSNAIDVAFQELISIARIDLQKTFQ